MKCIVTGAAGFIGSHTAEALKERGDDAIGVDNVNDYYDQAQKERNIASLKGRGIPLHRLDIRGEGFRELVERERPDVIIHLAAMAGVRYSIKEPQLYMDVNVKGTQNVLDAAKSVGAYVVAASSSSVYGGRTEVPFRETDRVDAQISPYAASKKATELLCHVHTHLTGLPTACLRFFTVYGPRGRPDMAPFKFMQRILAGQTIDKYGDGTSARDYTYVDDIVQGVLAAADHPDGHQVYNLGNSTPVTLNAFIETMERVCGKKAVINQMGMQPGDVPITYADVSRAAQKLGYAPTTPLEEGLKKQFAWFTEVQQ